MKHTFLLIILLFTIGMTYAQNKSTSNDSIILDKALTDDILNQLKKQIQDPIYEAKTDACKCIDSIDSYNLGKEEINSKISSCIKKHTLSTVVFRQTYNAIFNNGNDTINVDDESKEFKKTYYELERLLMDSCPSIKELVKVNNQAIDNAYSNNPEAIKLYEDGIRLSEKGDIQGALEAYYAAIKIDNKFVFCWDNIGVLERKLTHYDKAIYAYNQSLSINPSGATALQNLPVVYEKQKKYDKAAAAYKKFIKVDPNNPEGYFGLSRMQLIEGDMEESLENACIAYNIYIDIKSPYRSDGEQLISIIYAAMKKENKLDKFNSILKKNNISPIKE